MLMPYLKSIFQLILTFLLLNDLKLTRQQQQVSMPNTSGGLNQNIYQFIKATQMTSRFGELLDRLAQVNGDQSLIQALSAQSTTQTSSGSPGFTVFVPTNEALSGNNVPRDPDQLTNDVKNLITKEILTLERLRQMNGLNISRTFGYKPHLMLRIVKNFYSARNIQNTDISTNIPIGKRSLKRRINRQLYPNQNTNQQWYPGQTSVYPGQTTTYPGQNYNQGITSYPGQTTFPGLSYQPGQPTQFPGQQSPFPGQQTQYPGQIPMNQSSSASLYEMYNQISAGQNQNNQALRISLKLPQDELFLLNGAIILDKYELTNGIVYIINDYPRFFEKSILGLLQQNDVNGLSQNLNTWINTATQMLRMGDETLSNALNAFGPNTYFLPTDQAFQTFTYRANLSNSSFVFDVLFKAHRVTNQILFDYYLDDTAQTYYTDYISNNQQNSGSGPNSRQLPVSTVHRMVNGKEEIEVSIGHVKGRILPEFRNIYCASGVIHLVDTVLGIPGRNAYQEISVTNDLSILRSIIDRSSTYSQMLNQMPGVGQMGGSDFTFLAPSNAALEGIKDMLLSNTSMIDEFLSGHLITGYYYTDHDDSLFQNNQVYNTLNPNIKLIATVSPHPSLVTNNVGFKSQANSMIRTTILNGNDRVSNGVIHIVDRAITSLESTDITSMIEKYSRVNTPGSPAFNQFIDVLRLTGVFNDLKQPSSHFTLFIPTNEALAGYQDIINSNDLNQKRNLVYRHLCKDQHLDSNFLGTGSSQGGFPTPNNPNQNQNVQLTCRNALGQDLTLTKDVTGLMSQWQGNAESKVLNDFPGIYSSAYLLEKPLLNPNLPNMGLNNVNAALQTQMYSKLCLFICFVFCLYDF